MAGPGGGRARARGGAQFFPHAEPRRAPRPRGAAVPPRGDRNRQRDLLRHARPRAAGVCAVGAGPVARGGAGGEGGALVAGSPVARRGRNREGRRSAGDGGLRPPFVPSRTVVRVVYLNPFSQEVIGPDESLRAL